MLQSVRILAEVPKNPLGLDTPIRTSDVSSLTGFDKKKRSEIALAVDGHSIGIYDVRSGSIVTSYAISPTTSLTCPPCAIKLNKTATREARRSTYCSILDPQPKIVCFSEDNQKHISRGGSLKKSAFTLPENQSPVVHVEALATVRNENQDTSIDVLCFQEDGEIRCHDEALETEKWTTRITSSHDGGQKAKNLQIVYVSAISIQQATRIILKNRDDLVKILDANQDSYLSTILLVLIRSIPDSAPRSQGALTIRILAIRRTQVNGLGAFLGKKDPLVHLASFPIPEPLDVRGNDAIFKLHASSGLLYQENPGYLSIYDLTTIVPRVVQTMNFTYAKAGLSSLRLSTNLLATSSADAVFLIDTKFTSFQARFALPMPKQARSKISNHDNSKSPNDGKASVQLLSYHRPSSSAIILFGRSLMAVDLSAVITGKKASRKRKRDGLLIDAIGRGSLSIEGSGNSRLQTADTPNALGQILDPYEENVKWKDRQESLDSLLEKGDLVEYDRMITSALKDEKFNAGYGAFTTHPPQYVVDYLLSKAFSTTGSDGSIRHEDGCFLSGLHVRHLPESAWQYLTQKGLISTERLQTSLKRQSAMQQNNALTESGLIQAIADYDTTMVTLLSLLQSPCLLKISEVCHALKICTSKYALLAAPTSTKLLQANESIRPELETSDGVDLETGNLNSRSSEMLGDRDRFSILLDTIIRRCNPCPALLLTRALKRQLSISELRNVVDLLRINLAQNGWLSFCTDDGPTANDEKQYSDNQISMIAKLLNCIVDGLGTRGWLLNNSVVDNSAEPVETISYMKTEICAALEGIEEAAYLQGMLGEILLCGKGALTSRTPRPSFLDWGDKQKCALPLGLKLDHSISLTKIGAGGEVQKRSRRDIGKLKSMRVPEYSFERIAL
ncbi:MAG: hypothetical protein Q9216_002783 [Gyalolechia sp. 2 TL-2023]